MAVTEESGTKVPVRPREDAVVAGSAAGSEERGGAVAAAGDEGPTVAGAAGGATGRPPISRLTIDEIRVLIAGAPPGPGDSLWDELASDPRKGVTAIREAAIRARRRSARERARLEGLRRHEAELWAKGVRLVAGVDEAGRGPLAGPVVAAAVVLPRDLGISGIDDSKKLTPSKREELYERIRADALAVGVGSASEKVIDEVNILRATFRAMRDAVAGLERVPDHVLVDGEAIPDLGLPQTGILRGDERSAAIAAASIVAKVTRDRLLVEYDALYPGYGFAQHKGYGTPEHIAALTRLGPCEIHRLSFRIVHDARGGFSEPYRRHRDALLAADGPDALDRASRAIARDKDGLDPFELAKLRTLYKRCYVRLRAGLVASR
jgi:ribonuclease HII